MIYKLKLKLLKCHAKLIEIQKRMKYRSIAHRGKLEVLEIYWNKIINGI